MTDAWEVIFHINTLTAALRLATPIALAALAGTLSERAGVINLGLEGKLLAGAWAAVYATYLTGAPWVGVLAAVAAGMLVGALLGLFAVGLRANHVVAGVGLNILLLGLTTWLMQVVWDSRGTSPTVAALPRWTIPGLRDVPLLGDLLGSHSPLVYFTLLAAPLLWVVLFKTPVGLRVRMIGEHPEAADTLGIPVHRLQYLSLLAAGGLAALGGAQLALGDLAWFSQNMSAGRGYMALAANVFGQWNPLGSLLASLLFALTDAMQMRIQTLPNPWPTELVQMLPYLLTIAVLSGAVRRGRPPAALGRHYPPEPGAGAP
ncbi:MAG: ABC transporter permease [Limnochordales bacterium]